jgi:hypothetical protein
MLCKLQLIFSSRTHGDGQNARAREVSFPFESLKDALETRLTEDLVLL